MADPVFKEERHPGPAQDWRCVYCGGSWERWHACWGTMMEDRLRALEKAVAELDPGGAIAARLRYLQETTQKTEKR